MEASEVQRAVASTMSTAAALAQAVDDAIIVHDSE